MGKQKPPSNTAQAKQKWHGFRPVAYRLDWKVIDEIPIYVIRERTDGGDDSATPTTVGKALVDLRDKQVEADSLMSGVVVKTFAGQERFAGSPFGRNLLYVLVRLHKDGVNPFAATWFFYDTDTSQDAVTCYTFFLVCDGKIAWESVSIFRDPGDSEFNPAVFKEPNQGLDWIWVKDSYRGRAETAFWYRKFYIETKAGQLMLLRPDQPVTYFFYPEDKWRIALLGVFNRRLRKTNALLMTLLILVLLALVVWLWR
jgi:hypothetical protein